MKFTFSIEAETFESAAKVDRTLKAAGISYRVNGVKEPAQEIAPKQKRARSKGRTRRGKLTAKEYDKITIALIENPGASSAEIMRLAGVRAARSTENLYVKMAREGMSSRKNGNGAYMGMKQ